MKSKRIFDLCASLLLILMVSPVLIGVAIIISLSGRPPIYRSKRIGLNGCMFNCYKFTSMKDISTLPIEIQNNILKELHTKGHMKNDPRVTKFGKWIRKTSIDELPQLFNVLFGNMSLVGPRPISQYEADKYGKKIEYYKKSTPGITGIWQVSGRDEVKYKRRVAMDILYYKKGCLYFDLFILLKTPAVVFKMSGVN
ncbi:sugar transferase [Klebsiella pneumoniae]|uniref:sugar transferase n=1 Tax=Klebsiella pneumoniae TaxID=573 RepID=UPI0007CBE463|nr:sugar transferase [Klebsiella pneumoniae]SAU26153.1 undecaprenyl-phosphate galactose phosphotransferase [Klebsiella pneumoniae]